jgi:hypothetical protein
LSRALYKSAIVISTLFEKATLFLQKNFGGMRSVIFFCVASLLQMDLLRSYNKARHSAQVGTGAKVILNELLLESSVLLADLSP